MLGEMFSLVHDSIPAFFDSFVIVVGSSFYRFANSSVATHRLACSQE